MTGPRRPAKQCRAAGALALALGFSCVPARAPSAAVPCAASTADARADTSALLAEREGSNRPDGPILDDVREVFAQRQELADVFPTVRQRVVELTGTVTSAELSALAASRAFEVDGVFSVVNRLKVVPGASLNDAVLRQRVVERLAAHPAIESSSIRVLAKGGRVSLRGAVGSAAERWMAVDAAAGVAGVRLVHEQLEVTREHDVGVSEQELVARMREALSRRPIVAGDRLRVSFTRGKLWVRGDLTEPAAIEAALASAYEAGVSGVVISADPPRGTPREARYLWVDEVP